MNQMFIKEWRLIESSEIKIKNNKISFFAIKNIIEYSILKNIFKQHKLYLKLKLYTLSIIILNKQC